MKHALPCASLCQWESAPATFWWDMLLVRCLVQGRDQRALKLAAARLARSGLVQMVAMLSES